jgi:hypothetical protein
MQWMQKKNNYFLWKMNIMTYHISIGRYSHRAHAYFKLGDNNALAAKQKLV